MTSIIVTFLPQHFEDKNLTNNAIYLRKKYNKTRYKNIRQDIKIYRNVPTP